jgi:hypothetical protein
LLFNDKYDNLCKLNIFNIIKNTPMKTTIFGLLIAFFLLSSCSKDNDMTVTLKTDGSLTVKLINSDNNAIPDTKVSLYVGSASGSCLDYYTTSSCGSVDFGEVLSGTYYVVADTPKVDGIKYKPGKLIQIPSGVDKDLVINVEDYIGTLRVTITKAAYLGGAAFSNLDVILVPSESYSASYSVTTLIAKAEFTGKTDTQGVVTFTNPSSRDYRLIVYNSRKTKKNALTLVNLAKDELKKLSYSLDTSMALAK